MFSFLPHPPSVKHFKLKAALILLLLVVYGAPAKSWSQPSETPPAKEAPAVEAPAEKTPAVPDAAWVGDWVMGDRILSTTQEGEMKLMQDGEVVMSGPLGGEGLTRTAPLDGCGADLKLSEVGGDITLALDGPECPINFIGVYINTVSP